MVTNARSVGGFKNLPGRDVHLDDGLFEVTLIKRPKNPIELNEIIASLLTAEDKTSLIDSFKTDRIQEIPWTLDGEYGGEHSFVRIEAQKHAMELVLNPEKSPEALKAE